MNKSTIKLGVLLFLSLILAILVSCTQDYLEKAEKPEAPLYVRKYIPAPPEPAREVEKSRKEQKTYQDDSSLASMWAERKLIRTGRLEIEVVSVEKAADRIRHIAETHAGLLADTKITQDSEGHHRATLKVRVPSANFVSTIVALKTIGSVKNESVETRDVTKEYTDLETRLQVKRQTEQRLRDILRTRTGKLSEVLEVEKVLDRVIGQIEQMKGEKRYYDQQVSVSRITLELYEPHAIIRPSVFSDIRRAFQDSIRVLASSIALLVYVLTFVVPWLILAAIIWWIVWIIRKRKAAKKKAD